MPRNKIKREITKRGRGEAGEITEIEKQEGEERNETHVKKVFLLGYRVFITTTASSFKKDKEIYSLLLMYH